MALIHGSKCFCSYFLFFIAAKPPFFLNLPYTTTLYTHQTGTVITTYSVTDLDPQDVDGLNVSDSGVAGFTHDPAARKYMFHNLSYDI